MSSDTTPSYQGVAEHLAGLLSLLIGPDFQGLGTVDGTEITLSLDDAWRVHEYLRELLPECWSASTWYGYARPNECAFPDAICVTCACAGRRLPWGRKRPAATGDES